MIFKIFLKMISELVVFLLNHNALCSEYHKFLKKVKTMTSFLSRAASIVRSALTQDVATVRALEKNYVDVALRSRHGGA
jgi:hypothetical protein